MAIDVREAVILGAVSGLLAAGAAQAQQEAVQLSPVVVKGESADPADSSDRILLPTTTSATKTGTPVLETAQSISTITRKQLDDQAPQTVSEALRYTAGVLSDRDWTADDTYTIHFRTASGGSGVLQSTAAAWVAGVMV